MTDTELQHAVSEELEWAPDADALGIEVGVGDGWYGSQRGLARLPGS